MKRIRPAHDLLHPHHQRIWVGLDVLVDLVDRRKVDTQLLC
jgi:hypothetical protein